MTIPTCPGGVKVWGMGILDANAVAVGERPAGEDAGNDGSSSYSVDVRSSYARKIKEEDVKMRCKRMRSGIQGISMIRRNIERLSVIPGIFRDTFG